ncbi:MAG: dihydroorotase [Firmicutes bacterium]|nr:dihydroorotase [Bacillota bacterium]
MKARHLIENLDHIRAYAEKTQTTGGYLSFESNEYIIVPGLCDVHVHFREPGFSYKETVLSGSAAAARGGYTAVCTMPNLNPVPDCAEHLKMQTDIIARDASVKILPYGAITFGESGKQLADMRSMADSVCAFSDDGRGVQSGEMMREAMKTAKSLGRIIAAHCENNSLLNGGYIHDGRYAAAHGHKGISSASEYSQIERDIALARETGCAYHVCHISTKESVDLIRRAKADGVDITCETAPHYLTLCEDDLQEDGRFKMNPPLRGREDKEALLCGIQDGTIDMIATDHAPHSAEEKARGLAGSLMGVVGLETAFAVLYTALVREGVITLEQLVRLMSVNPRRRFGIDGGGDFAVFDVSAPYTVNPDEFASCGRSTPFAGRQVYGRCLLTVHDGKVVYSCDTF